MISSTLRSGQLVRIFRINNWTKEASCSRFFSSLFILTSFRSQSLLFVPQCFSSIVGFASHKSFLEAFHLRTLVLRLLFLSFVLLLIIHVQSSWCLTEWLRGLLESSANASADTWTTSTDSAGASSNSWSLKSWIHWCWFFRWILFSHIHISKINLRRRFGTLRFTHLYVWVLTGSKCVLLFLEQVRRVFHVFNLDTIEASIQIIN